MSMSSAYLQPRTIPFRGRIRVIFERAQVQVALGVFTFLSLFFWAFGGVDFVRTILFFQHGVAEKTVPITDITDAHVEVNDVPMYSYHYRYTYGEQTYEGYTDGPPETYEKGESVTIEVAENAPRHSRIKDVAMFPPAFPWVFGVLECVLLVVALLGMRKGRAHVALLRKGIPVESRLRRVIPTNVRVNRNRVFKFVFAFTDDAGEEHEITYSTHEIARILPKGTKTRMYFEEEYGMNSLSGIRAALYREMNNTPLAVDEEDVIVETLVYDPLAPQNAVVLSSLPGAPFIDEYDAVTFAAKGNALLPLILPVAVFVVNAFVVTVFVL